MKKILKGFVQEKHVTNSNPGKSFDEIYNDPGVFTYFEEGFAINYQELAVTIKWEEITQINVYKADLMTIDEIRMEIVSGDNRYTINEELPGWYQFVLKTKEMFPSIPKDWDLNSIHPAFAANYSTIYSKEN
ncbi:MAG: hypothetical protein J7502_00650 [Flavisolibacter sp.]|nr:hypothetical protein [Flavisolibacter sp.]